MDINKIQIIIQQRVKQYLLLSKAIRNNHSAKTIHAFRVASRQLLALEPVLNTPENNRYWAKKANSWLKRCGEIRNLQVLQHKFDFSQRVDTILEQAINKEIKNNQEIFKKIGGKKFREELTDCTGKFYKTIEKNPNQFAHKVLDAWSVTKAELLDSISSLQPDTPKTFHQLRIKYKKVRYLVDFLDEAQLININLSGELKHWQNRLGEIQDLSMGEAWLADIPRTIKARSNLNAQSKKLRIKFILQTEQFKQLISALDRTIKTALKPIARSSSGELQDH